MEPRLASFQIPQAGDRWTVPPPYIHAGNGGYLNFILPLSAETDLSSTVVFFIVKPVTIALII